MYPVVLGALATRVAAIARSAGPTLTAAAARLRALGATVGSTADDVMAWVKTNPANASLLAMTLASLGVSMADVFETPEGQAAATRLQTGKAALSDESRMLEAGRASEKLNLQIAESTRDAYLAIDILRFARNHYGSVQNAVDAHMRHQAFFEMPLDDVRAGFDTLKV